MPHQQRSETNTPGGEPDSHATARLKGCVPVIWTAVELIGAAVSPFVAAWLANRFGLAYVGLYFVLAAGVSAMGLFID